ncbi:hypothetical protein I7I51_08276 [Histoplasma capsulatum]|uniref:Uncharacterized protein n=1 Tax=Ajellomyces capsulatus TaxID=5037 RepID=A0A8A1M3T5_AJECA|nr:hypothetical protein I7I51_08276 [Histoplasma capsulatum]
MPNTDSAGSKSVDQVATNQQSSTPGYPGAQLGSPDLLSRRSPLHNISGGQITEEQPNHNASRRSRTSAIFFFVEQERGATNILVVNRTSNPSGWVDSIGADLGLWSF